MWLNKNKRRRIGRAIIVFGENPSVWLKMNGGKNFRPPDGWSACCSIRERRRLNFFVSSVVAVVVDLPPTYYHWVNYTYNCTTMAYTYSDINSLLIYNIIITNILLLAHIRHKHVVCHCIAESSIIFLWHTHIFMSGRTIPVNIEFIQFLGRPICREVGQITLILNAHMYTLPGPNDDTLFVCRS